MEEIIFNLFEQLSNIIDQYTTKYRVVILKTPIQKIKWKTTILEILAVGPDMNIELLMNTFKKIEDNKYRPRDQTKTDVNIKIQQYLNNNNITSETLTKYIEYLNAPSGKKGKKDPVTEDEQPTQKRKTEDETKIVKKNKNTDRIPDFLIQAAWQCVKIPSDGNCFYYCIMYFYETHKAIFGDIQCTPQSLRNDIVTFLIDNKTKQSGIMGHIMGQTTTEILTWEYYAYQIYNEDQVNADTFDEILDRIAKYANVGIANWASNLEIQVLQRIYKFSIAIYGVEDTFTGAYTYRQSVFEQGECPVLYLNFANKNHYEVLIDKMEIPLILDYIAIVKNENAKRQTPKRVRGPDSESMSPLTPSRPSSTKRPTRTPPKPPSSNNDSFFTVSNFEELGHILSAIAEENIKIDPYTLNTLKTMDVTENIKGIYEAVTEKVNQPRLVENNDRIVNILKVFGINNPDKKLIFIFYRKLLTYFTNIKAVAEPVNQTLTRLSEDEPYFRWLNEEPYSLPRDPSIYFPESASGLFEPQNWGTLYNQLLNVQQLAAFDVDNSNLLAHSPLYLMSKEQILVFNDTEKMRVNLTKAALLEATGAQIAMLDDAQTQVLHPPILLFTPEQLDEFRTTSHLQIPILKYKSPKLWVLDDTPIAPVGSKKTKYKRSTQINNIIDKILIDQDDEQLSDSDSSPTSLPKDYFSDKDDEQLSDSDSNPPKDDLDQDDEQLPNSESNPTSPQENPDPSQEETSSPKVKKEPTPTSQENPTNCAELLEKQKNEYEALLKKQYAIVETQKKDLSLIQADNNVLKETEKKLTAQMTKNAAANTNEIIKLTESHATEIEKIKTAYIINAETAVEYLRKLEAHILDQRTYRTQAEAHIVTLNDNCSRLYAYAQNMEQQFTQEVNNIRQALINAFQNDASVFVGQMQQDASNYINQVIQNVPIAEHVIPAPQSTPYNPPPYMPPPPNPIPPPSAAPSAPPIPEIYVENIRRRGEEASLKQEINENTREIRRLTAKLTTATQSENKLKAEVRRLNERINETKDDEEFAILAIAEKIALERTVDNMQKVIEELKLKIGSLPDTEYLQTIINKLTFEKEMLNRLIEKFTKTIADQEAKLKTSNSGGDDLDDDDENLKELQAQLDEGLNENEELRKNLEDLQTQLDERLNKNEELLKNLEDLQAKYNDLAFEHNQYKDWGVEYQDANTELEDKILKLTEELRQLREEEEEEQLQEENNRLTQQLQELTTNIQRILSIVETHIPGSTPDTTTPVVATPSRIRQIWTSLRNTLPTRAPGDQPDFAALERQIGQLADDIRKKDDDIKSLKEAQTSILTEKTKNILVDNNTKLKEQINKRFREITILNERAFYKN